MTVGDLRKMLDNLSELEVISDEDIVVATKAEEIRIFRRKTADVPAGMPVIEVRETLKATYGLIPRWAVGQYGNSSKFKEPV